MAEPWRASMIPSAISPDSLMIPEQIGLHQLLQQHFSLLMGLRARHRHLSIIPRQPRPSPPHLAGTQITYAPGRFELLLVLPSPTDLTQSDWTGQECFRP